jgi:transcriptional regulator with XRE-family HTH domain
MTTLPESTPGETLTALTAHLHVVRRPPAGWLRTVREALGMSRRAVAEKLDVSPAAVRDYEVAEANDTITLATLRRMAGAMGCEVVCALVPRHDRSFSEVAPSPRDRPPAKPATARREVLPVAPTAPDDNAELESHLK